ncbi:hypothetical protein ACJMK2_006338 [Sinanodonta woodiana]|uniref:RRM domain-containing protein n=1 Tax=Sinanodonta woodiana TaxID=1069815 RepID=A0ABD3VSU5_SINWO
MAEKKGRQTVYSSDHELSSDFVEGQKQKGNYALKKMAKDEPIRKIKVTKIPDGAVEETLINYFENMRRNGGGPIESIEYHPATSSAIIEFEEADAVDKVLKKRPLLFLKRQISVEEYVAKVEEEEEEELTCRTVEVRGFAENTSEDVLEMYFENSKRSGGSEVTSVVIEGDAALVTFTDENVASCVCEREHILGGRKLSVSLHLPKKKSAVDTGREEEIVEPACTVEVRGYKVGSEGTVELHFENTKRSGGDEIVSFEPVDSDGVIFITYASEEVAKRVSECQHCVAGCTLDVKLYEPPKHKFTRKLSKIGSKQPEGSVPHCVITVKGVTRRIIEPMPLYFENKRRSGGDEIVKFEYSEENEIAYITYQSEEDFEKLEEACKKRSLEGSYLLPSKVYVSNSIIISNLKTTTTEDTIELYFENEKRSWGGPVEKVEFKRDEEYCLVFFEDYTICDQVLKRKHKIDGSELHISIYYENLGRISEDENGPYFKPPKPVKLEGLDFAKMQILMRSEPNRTALEKQLQDCFTQIQWPQTETDCTILTCTLKSDVPDCKKTALTWATQAEKTLNDFLKVISVHNLEVFQEIFETVLQNLQNLTIANPDAVALFVKNAEFCIQVVGHKAVVTVVVKDIEDIIKKAESDFDRKKKQTRESLTNLKHHQLKLLLAQKYPSQMDQQYNGLKVKINLNKNEIVFEGLMEDIRTAQVAMYEAVHNAAVTQLKNLLRDAYFCTNQKR